MKKSTKSLIVFIIGLIGFVTVTIFQGGGIGGDLAEDCRQVVAQTYSGTSELEQMMERCEEDGGFAALMTTNSQGVDAVVGQIASVNRREVRLHILKRFLLGLGLAGLIGFGMLKARKE